jgi:DNA-directed RNA polymerase sigma subunit (sigma70/sigma32)
MTRSEAHLLLAGIRVLDHLSTRPPTPAEIAELLQMSESEIRLQLSLLHDLGAVLLVDSAYETHAEIKDPSCVETLAEKDGPAISEDLAAFDRMKEEEAEKMANLFDSGEHEVRRQKKISDMDEELKGFRRNRPPNPFGDD